MAAAVTIKYVGVIIFRAEWVQTARTVRVLRCSEYVE